LVGSYFLHQCAVHCTGCTANATLLC
jgi:hypothetical protein